MINATERLRFDRLRRDGNKLIFEIDVYDAVLEATPRDGYLVGEWRKRAREGQSRLPFTATFGYSHRFERVDGPEIAGAPASIDGIWTMTFVDDDGPFQGRAELQQTGRRVTGTILTPTGDYRYLDGDYAGGRLRLSTFDGAHAFLFAASIDGSGVLKGNFWSRDVYRAGFTARPKTAADEWPDAFREVGLRPGEKVFAFTFPDVEGHMVSSTDERFRGRVVVVELFGTWCPNCSDLAPLLVEWHRKYRTQGLEVVGLAYEYTDDPEEANERLRAYAARHSVEYPLLRAGVSDKDVASATVPALERIKAYPTTIFVGRDGNVSRIHSGFAGPATGAHYVETKRQMVAEIERLLAVPAPAARSRGSANR